MYLVTYAYVLNLLVCVTNIKKDELRMADVSFVHWPFLQSQSDMKLFIKDDNICNEAKLAWFKNKISHLNAF